jgi:hypothetical protein
LGGKPRLEKLNLPNSHVVDLVEVTNTCFICTNYKFTLQINARFNVEEFIDIGDTKEVDSKPGPGVQVEDSTQDMIHNFSHDGMEKVNLYRVEP